MTARNRLAHAIRSAILSGILLAASLPAEAGPGYVNFFLGQKLLDEDDWDPIDKQAEFGVESAFGPATWPVHMALYLARSSEEKEADFGFGPVTLDATAYEFGAGLNKTWTAGKLYPHLGAGLTYAKVDVTLRESGTSTSDDANGFGGWGGAGAFYRIGTRFNFGGAVRYSTASVDFNAFDTGNVAFQGADIEAGGLHLGVLLGWGWPATPPATP